MYSFALMASILSIYVCIYMLEGCSFKSFLSDREPHLETSFDSVLFEALALSG